MKIHLFTLFIGFIALSCQKEPTACILIEPGTTVTVFDNVTLTSCSEDAHYLNWEIEEFQNGNQVFQVDIAASVNFIWDDAGTFDIYLTASSENLKKEDFASAQVTLEDVCYKCTNGANDSDICYSDYEGKSVFEAALANFESAGFTCTLK
ncbi:hypothetical protein OAA53_01920 [Salibacteraceae bacterium]|nr:hypothetical protein [Salibacteraceae bacterium]